MSAQFLKDKAREISYALIRVAWYIKRSDLRSRLESLAVELLENSARVGADKSVANLDRALATISVLDGLVRLAYSVYEIEPVNANILVRELDNLNSAIRQFGNPADHEEKLPNLDDLFTTTKKSNENKISLEKLDNPKVADVHQQSDSPRLVNLNDLSGVGEVENRTNNFNTAIRQSAIINRIKSGNGAGCRLKDLMVEFPDVSERTLRYDLQRLCERGMVERVGNGGPASYYKLVLQPVESGMRSSS
ncbi:MAG: hypothetical protein HZB99_03105 [Candidatus Harrisonbacteria bacterium]|nr:hypothetical protein [Candidatus Harrisonbacteria bacterium]